MPSWERGGVVPLRRYKGDMTRRFNLGTEDGEAPAAAGAAGGQQGQGDAGAGEGGGAAQQGQGHRGDGGAGGSDDEEEGAGRGAGDATGGEGRKNRDAEGFEGSELGYGETGLLYSEVQLYTHCRRAAQVLLVQVCAKGCAWGVGTRKTREGRVCGVGWRRAAQVLLVQVGAKVCVGCGVWGGVVRAASWQASQLWTLSCPSVLVRRRSLPLLDLSFRWATPHPHFSLTRLRVTTN